MKSWITASCMKSLSYCAWRVWATVSYIKSLSYYLLYERFELLSFVWRVWATVSCMKSLSYCLLHEEFELLSLTLKVWAIVSCMKSLSYCLLHEEMSFCFLPEELSYCHMKRWITVYCMTLNFEIHQKRYSSRKICNSRINKLYKQKFENKSFLYWDQSVCENNLFFLWWASLVLVTASAVIHILVSSASG